MTTALRAITIAITWVVVLAFVGILTAANLGLL